MPFYDKALDADPRYTQIFLVDANGKRIADVGPTFLPTLGLTDEIVKTEAIKLQLELEAKAPVLQEMNNEMDDAKAHFATLTKGKQAIVQKDIDDFKTMKEQQANP